MPASASASSRRGLHPVRLGALADPEQRGPGPGPAHGQRAPVGHPGQQLRGGRKERAAIVLVEPVLGGLADQEPAVGQAGDEQGHPRQVERRTLPAHLAGKRLAGP